MADERRSYRKIYKRLWSDPAFIAMTDSERNMALYVLTGSQSNRIGLFKFSIPMAAEDLRRPINTVRRVFARVLEAFGWVYDGTCRVLWIPSWWKYNPPPKQGTNIKGYLSDLNDLPRTELIAQFRAHLCDVPLTLHEHFAERRTVHRSSTAKSTAPSTARATETETDTETETERETPAAPPPAPRPMAPIHDRAHRNHAHCGRVCLHASLFSEFVRRRNHDGADLEIRDWAMTVEREWGPDGPRAQDEPGDAFEFWKARYAEQWPAVRQASARMPAWAV